MKPTHTKTPWAVVPNKNSSSPIPESFIVAHENKQNQLEVVFTGFLHPTNASFIVKAVNNHESLVEALKEVISVSDRDTDIYNKAKQALKNAESEA